LGDEFEADATGMGCFLVKREVIERLAQQKPIFSVEDKENASVKGEDVIFCDKIKLAGYKIWVSKKVRAGHFGGIVFPAKP
jgi:GT2 family glycosyltransferase